MEGEGGRGGGCGAVMAMEGAVTGNAASLIAQDNAAPAPSTARANLSSIMPGWFSEISPMWPGREGLGRGILLSASWSGCSFQAGLLGGFPGFGMVMG